MPVDINAMAYSPVEDGLEESDDGFWQVSTRNMSIDQEILEIFIEYLAEIIVKPDTNQVSIGKFREDARTEDYLNQITALDLQIDERSDDYDTFEEIAQTFAVRLINHMDGSTSSGVLFTIQATRDGETFVGVLKLDLEDEQRSVLDQQTRRLRYEELDDVLPDPDEFQKGCTYPVFESSSFSVSGDIKFLQKDAPSNYFREFLGCLTGNGSLKQVRNILDAIDEIKETHTNHGLTPDDIQYFYENTGQDDHITEEEVRHTASEIIGPNFDEDELDRELYERDEEYIGADPDNAPQNVKWIIDGDIEIKAPVDALDEDRIQIREPDHLQDDWEATIRGSNVDREYQE